MASHLNAAQRTDGDQPDFVAPKGPTREPVDPGTLPRIEGRYVHKVNQRNVLLARVDAVSGEEDCYVAEVTPDWDHPFFFEHPLDHVPAMFLVEAGRQKGIAVAHLHLGVPFGVVFITTSFEIKFTDFAEVHSPDPLIITTRVSEKAYHRRKLCSIRLDCLYTQGGRTLGRGVGTCDLYPRELYLRLRGWDDDG